MWLRKYLTVCQCLIIYIQYYIENVKPLIGENVRQGEDKEFPFIVSLMKSSNESSGLEKDHFCTGVLISMQDVLTAEHCLTEKIWSDIEIIVGSADLTFGKRYYSFWRIEYEKWARHKNISLEFSLNDISIIRLTENIPPVIRPALLSSVPNKNIYGLTVDTAGWGISNSGEYPKVIKTVKLKVLKNSECENKLAELQGKKVFFHKRLLCTAAIPFALIHFGDSGGPVLYNNNIVGINYRRCSYEEYMQFDIKCLSKQVNIHFGIDYYRKFILDIIFNF